MGSGLPTQPLRPIIVMLLLFAVGCLEYALELNVFRGVATDGPASICVAKGILFDQLGFGLAA